MIWAVILTIGALSSLAGLFLLHSHQSAIRLDAPATTHRILIVQAYLLVLAALIGAHLVMGLVTVAVLGASKADFIGWCTMVASDLDDFLSTSQWRDECLGGYRIVLFTAVGALVVPFLVNLCMSLIASWMGISFAV